MIHIDDHDDQDNENIDLKFFFYIYFIRERFEIRYYFKNHLFNLGK